MNGVLKSLSNTGCPWPGGDEVAFEAADVRRLGKLYCWGSSCVQFIVQLHDGREAFVRADKQTKADEKFLRRLAKPIRSIRRAQFPSDEYPDGGAGIRARLLKEVRPWSQR